MKNILLLLGFCMPLMSLAQYRSNYQPINQTPQRTTTRSGNISGSINVQVSIPQGEYQAIGNKVGFGLRGNILFSPNETFPFKVGADLGLLVVSSRRKDFYYGGTFGSHYYIDASSNVFSIGLMLRFEPLRGVKNSFVSPFLDGVIGGNGFYASVDFNSSTTSYNNYNNSNNSRTQWGLYYGGSGGLLFPITNKVTIEGKISYLIGGRTDYLTDPVIDANGSVSFTSKNSETTMLLPQLGVKIGL
ncbi:MAG: hypothetical protein U0Y10_14000 [Spirosomataceae bacterium]